MALNSPAIARAGSAPPAGYGVEGVIEVIVNQRLLGPLTALSTA
jgi:hypothetical protein